MLKKLCCAVLTAAMIASSAVLPSMAAEVAAAPAAVYPSELSGIPTNAAIASQRPIAVMIDNDRRALPHYGLGEAEVVYEMVNSTANNRITRLMALYKNWGAISRIGNIRSTRPTNILLAAEWNAVLIHDGGPFYNNPYFAGAWSPQHIGGGFSRINNGKPSEFTEYLVAGEMSKKLAANGIQAGYTAYPGPHFKFGLVDYGAAGIPATVATLPFFNTSSKLQYNAATSSYDYYEFGSLAKDGEDSQVVTFKNVILQNVDIHQYDANGYLIYNCIGTGCGWYLTNGKAVPIVWIKGGEQYPTKYLDANMQEVTVNPGKTYIGLIPSDTWAQVGIK